MKVCGMARTTSSARDDAVNWAKNVLDKGAVILDFETSGLRDSEIVQVGMIDTDGNVLVDTLVKPTGAIEPGATRVHGITLDMVTASPTFKEVYVKISSKLAGNLAVAYNVSFDKGVLMGECKRLKLPPPRPRAWECAMQTYAKFYGQWNSHRRSYTWQSLSKACIQQEVMVENAHSAIGDCLMTLALIRKMAG